MRAGGQAPGRVFAGLALWCAVMLAGCSSGAVTSPEAEGDRSFGSSASEPGDGPRGARGDGPRKGAKDTADEGTDDLGASGGGSTGGPDGSDEGGGDPDGEDPGAGRQDRTDEDDQTEPEPFGWGLPPTDTSPSGNAGPMYATLQRGCEEGADFLHSAWEGFGSPRDVVLFAAAVELCRGNLEAGRRWYAHTAATYGMSGLLPEGQARCDVYKSIRSVLDQQPRAAFPCPGGAPPEGYRSGPGGLDNPLTLDVDESLAPTDSPAESPSGTS